MKQLHLLLTRQPPLHSPVPRLSSSSRSHLTHAGTREEGASLGTVWTQWPLRKVVGKPAGLGAPTGGSDVAMARGLPSPWALEPVKGRKQNNASFFFKAGVARRGTAGRFFSRQNADRTGRREGTRKQGSGGHGSYTCSPWHHTAPASDWVRPQKHL